MEALRRRYPDALIVGIEVDQQALSEAQARARSDSHMQVFRNAAALEAASFDVVTCLSVLCAYPPTRARPRLPFRLFSGAIKDILNLLRPGGVLAMYNAQYLVKDVPHARGLLETWWEGCTSASTFLENFPVYRPDGTVTEERMPLLHRRRTLSPPRNPTLEWLRKRYLALDDAVRRQGAHSVLHYYCWRGQAFQHSTLHLGGLQVDGYEPELGPFWAARQYSYVNPDADTRIVRSQDDLRPPYDVVIVMSSRFLDGSKALDASFEATHLPRTLSMLAPGPQARLLLCGPRPASSTLPGCRLEWERRAVTLSCYQPMP